MCEGKRVVGVGYSDFWDTARGLDPLFFNQLATFMPALDLCLRQEETEALPKTIRAITRMICDSLGGVSILALNGHDIDALRITRCMFEGAVTSAYLAKFPSELDDYLQFAKISAKALMDHSSTHQSSQAQESSDEARQKIVANYEEVKDRFKRGGRVRLTWNSKPVRQMFDEVGLEPWYTGFYHVASAAVHMNVRGMFMHYEPNDDGDPVIHPPPRKKFIAMSLAAARAATITSLQAYSEVTSQASTTLLVQQAINLFSVPQQT
ncbi:MAG: DUF5677 domain-containing protein [Acidobacteriaceae bacterium]